MKRGAAIESYRDLEVWRRGVGLVEQIYALSRRFPKEELYGLTAQLRRAAVSIPSNIAEGWGRGTRKDYMHFLQIARSSLLEMETQLIIAHRLGYLSQASLEEILAETETESRMLLALHRSLRP